jgi:hypothetical protein
VRIGSPVPTGQKMKISGPFSLHNHEEPDGMNAKQAIKQLSKK